MCIRQVQEIWKRSYGHADKRAAKRSRQMHPMNFQHEQVTDLLRPSLGDSQGITTYTCRSQRDTKKALSIMFAFQIVRCCLPLK